MQRFFNNPRVLMMIGMTCLLIANLPRFIHVPANINPHALDFTHGLLLGLSIVFNLRAVWINTHKSRCASS